MQVDKDSDPLDLSGLTVLTKLDAHQSPVLRLSTSLVECDVSLRSDTDLSSLTRLTSMGVSLEPGIRVTFPTGLKKLKRGDGKLCESNIGDVALESFVLMPGYLTTREELEKLPKTVKKVEGMFYPMSLEKRLGEMFPLLGLSEEKNDTKQ